LDYYWEEEKLVWHEGHIPNDEIWIKFGGDHGKGSFKLAMHICNVVRPNSKYNTHLINLAQVKDSVTNLSVIFSDLQQQIEQIRRVQWRGRKIIVFWYGDLDFLCKVYGLSGPQGTHPCVWCCQTKGEMQTRFTGARVDRSLSRLLEDASAFCKDGQNKKRAAIFNNVIRMPLIDIDVSHVAPPYLHIMLGIVLKHHVLLEKEAGDVDMLIARGMASKQNKANLFTIY
jgi:hypothetical protein